MDTLGIYSEIQAHQGNPVPLRSMLSLDDRGGRPAVEAKPVPAGEAESAEREPDDPFDDRLSICLGVRRRDW